MNKLFVICFLLLCSLGTYSQQTERKIISYSAPPYPPAARAVGAEGETEVLIAVNSEGEVVSATPFSGHPLLRQVSGAAARKWRFEKEAELKETQSLVIVFSFGPGEMKVIEKSENETEPMVRAEFSPPYRLNVLMDTLVPKLLLLPRENGVRRPKICPLHGEEMEVEIQEIYRGSYEEDLEAYSEGYADVMWENFPNSNEKYYGRNLKIEIKKAENHYCKTCRLKREQLGFGA